LAGPQRDHGQARLLRALRPAPDAGRADHERLHASSQWRRYAGQVSAGSPSDVWREGCWRFVVYPGYARGRPVDIVFAVYLQSRRPAVRAAVLDADTDEVLGPTGTRESAIL